MSREKWRLIRQSKEFYMTTYRWAGTLLGIAVSMNLIFALLIGKIYFSEPEPDYYATNGVTAPQKLTAMDEPNFTAFPLLPNDPISEETTRVIPE